MMHSKPLCRSVGQSVCRWLAVGCDHSFNFCYPKSKRDRLTRIFRSYLRTRLAVGELRFGGVAVWGSCGVRELWSPTQAYFLTAQSTHSYSTRLKKSKKLSLLIFFWLSTSGFSKVILFCNKICEKRGEKGRKIQLFKLNGFWQKYRFGRLMIKFVIYSFFR